MDIENTDYLNMVPRRSQRVHKCQPNKLNFEVKSKKKSVIHITSLPKDVLYQIFSYLDPDTIIKNVCKTNK
jgi:hypothetical protein